MSHPHPHLACVFEMCPEDPAELGAAVLRAHASLHRDLAAKGLRILSPITFALHHGRDGLDQMHAPAARMPSVPATVAYADQYEALLATHDGRALLVMAACWTLLPCEDGAA